MMLSGLAAPAWSQQPSFLSSTLLADAALPNAPEAQVSAAQQTPEQPSPGSIRGVVIGRDGSAYQGVSIALALPNPIGLPVRTLTSESDGRFNFANVPPGAFKLTISSNGFATQIISGYLHSGESFEVPAIVLLVAGTASEVRVTASQQEIALEQFRSEEKQRILGVIPNFFVTYVPNAPPLTSKQKFNLAWKSSIDPVTFLLTGIWAGSQQANNTFSGYGQGAQGYAKRYGANYSDGFIGTMIGSAILPSLLKQDPRYFYKGTGTIRSRALYAVAMSVVCKGDNGHWQPNYSAILGGLAAGGISNLYYPASDRDGVALTFENALLGTAGDAAQNLFQEFLLRKLTPKIPNYGAAKQ
ncbi:MAG TPA: carboxypeptidase-like regulatory domain-containing protein [Silvibacterium sp.]|nr:carboxypeptidase-like regulatory domain-containing protein [Silvibacterium sp.]